MNAANVDEAQISVLDGLWKEAYDELKQTKPKLVQNYAMIAKEEGCQTERKPLQESIPKVVQGRVDAMKKKQWDVGGIVIRDKIAKIVRLLDYFKDFGAAVAGLDPIHAGLPWAGISLLLPLLTNDTTQIIDALNGLEYIAELSGRWTGLESRLSREFSEKGPLRSSALKVFGLILEFQAAAACYFAKNTIKRFLRNVPKLDHWKTILTNLREAEAKLTARANDQSFAKIFAQVKELSIEAPPTKEKREPLLLMSPDPLFVGREDIISILRGGFKRTKRMALLGWAGIGKTQIANQYAWNIYQEAAADLIIWVRAGSVEHFEQSYSEIARELLLPGCDNPETNIKDKVKKWLSRKSNGTWFMVLDNVDDPTIFFLSSDAGATGPETQDGNTASNLHEFVPFVEHGSILITSRNHSSALAFVDNNEEFIVDVDLLPEDEATKLVRKKLPKTKHSDERARELALALHRLPLAITQATAYINVSRITISRYLKDYGEKLLDTTEFDPRRSSSLSSSNSVLKTWAISFEYIKKLDPDAAELLCFMGMISNQRIPRDLLVEGVGEGQSGFDRLTRPLKAFSLIHEESLDESDIDSDSDDDDDCTKEIDGTSDEEEEGILHNEDLGQPIITNDSPEDELSVGIRKRPTWPSPTNEREKKEGFHEEIHSWLSIHQLVQMSVRSWLHQEGTLQKWKETALTVLYQVFPVPETSKMTICQALMPHVETILKETFTTEESLLTYADLSRLVGTYLVLKCSYKDALSMITKAYSICVQHGRPELLVTKLTLFAVVLVNHSYGRYEISIKHARELLESLDEEKDKNFPYTIATMWLLGDSLSGQTKYDEAQRLLETALDKCKELLPADDNWPLRIQGTLAYALHGRGRLQEAFELFEKVYQTVLQDPELSKTDEFYLRVASNMCLILQEMGNLDQAEKLGREILQAQEKICGHNHISTLKTRGNLATTLMEKGKTDIALKMFDNISEALKEMFDESHAQYLWNESNRAFALLHHGAYRQASELCRKILAKQENFLGVNHLDTLRTLHALGIALKKEGRYKPAEEHLRKVLNSFEHLSQPGMMTHRGWACALDLCDCLACQGRFDDAEELFKSTIHMKEQVLGPNYPNWSFDQTSLVHILEGKNDFQNAELVTKAAVEHAQKFLKNRPNMFSDVKALYGEQLARQNPAEAVVFFQSMTEELIALLGSSADRTVNAKCTLIRLLLANHRQAEAEEVAREMVKQLSNDDKERPGPTIAALKVLAEVLMDDRFPADAATLSSTHNWKTARLNRESRIEEALQLRNRVIQLTQDIYGADSEPTLRAKTLICAYFRDIGKPEIALSQYQEVMQAQTVLLGEDHPEVLSTLHEIADLYRELERYDEATQLNRKILEIRLRVLGERSASTQSSMENLSYTLRSHKNLSEAESTGRDLVRLREATYGAKHLNTALSLNNLSMVLSDQEKHEEAERLIRIAVDIRSTQLGLDHKTSVLSRQNLAYVLHSRGRLEESDQIYIDLLKSQYTLVGPRRQTILDIMLNRMIVLMKQARNIERSTLHNEITEFCRVAFVDDGEQTILSAMEKLASTYAVHSHHQAASSLRYEISEAYKQAKLEDPRTEYKNLHWLGWSLKLQNRHSEAVVALKDALKTLLGSPYEETQSTSFLLSLELSELGKFSDAQAILETLLEKNHRAFGPASYHTGSARVALIQALRGVSKGSEPVNTLESIIKTYTTKHGLIDVRTLAALEALVETLHERADRNAAVLKSRDLVSRMNELYGKDGAETVRSVGLLGLLLQFQGDFAAAVSIHRRCLLFNEKEFGPTSWQCSNTMTSLIVTLRELEQFEEAESLSRKLIDARLAAKPPNTSAVILQARQNLAFVIADQATSSPSRLKEAETLQASILDEYKQLLPPEDPNVLTARFNHARILSIRGNNEKAIEQMRLVHLSRIQVTGGDSSATAVSGLGLGLLACDMRKYYEAELLLRRTMLARQRSASEIHPAYAKARNIHVLILIAIKKGRKLQRQQNTASGYVDTSV